MLVGQIRSVVREARGAGAERFLLTGDFNFELGVFLGFWRPLCREYEGLTWRVMGTTYADGYYGKVLGT